MFCLFGYRDILESKCHESVVFLNPSRISEVAAHFVPKAAKRAHTTASSAFIPDFLTKPAGKLNRSNRFQVSDEHYSPYPVKKIITSSFHEPSVLATTHSDE